MLVAWSETEREEKKEREERERESARAQTHFLSVPWGSHDDALVRNEQVIQWNDLAAHLGHRQHLAMLKETAREIFDSMDANGDGQMLPVCLSLIYADHTPRIVPLAGFLVVFFRTRKE